MRARQPHPSPAPAPVELRAINSKVEPIIGPKGLQFRVTIVTPGDEQVYLFDAQEFAGHATQTCTALEVVRLPAEGIAA